MNTTPARLSALLLAAATLASAAHAAPPAPSAKPAKMVTLYQAAKCHMYYTPAQAKIYHYACPDSKGKMTKVMVAPSVAKVETAKTNAALKAGDKPF